MFKNRIQAGRLLAKELKKYSGQTGVVLAVPRGAVPLAYVIARSLCWPLDIVLTKKIGHPGNKEYAIGAVSLTDRYMLVHEEVPDSYIEKETVRIRHRLQEMYQKFRGSEKPVPLKDKVVVVVDDGVATGNTLMATVRMIRKENPAWIVIAVPVASKHALEKLQAEADEVICLLVPELFFGVGAFYEDFSQVSDEQVMAFLSRLRKNDPEKHAA